MKALLVAVLCGLALFISPQRAEAKGIPLIYNTGEEAFATGPLPAPYDQEPQLAGYQAGYLCDIKGVLWSYFSVTNCKPVAFKGDGYTDEPELVQAISAKYKESDMQRGLWGHYGWMLLAGAVAVGGLLVLKDKFTGGKDDSTDKGPDAA